MRENLLKALTDWKEDENKVAVRKISYSNFPDGQGEYIVRVSEELNVTLNGKNKDISVKKNFLTHAQSENGLNPNGAIFRAEQITQIVGRDFYDKYSDAINELFLGYEGEFQEI